jgi:hypothetical protein
MCNTEIGYFCKTREDWLETLSAPPFCLNIKRDGKYVMFSYNQIESDFNHKIVREARGIIFENGKWENPVCWAFDKFGNYGESYVPEIDWDTALVTEKIDGSLIKVWWDGDWKISTNGTIDAFKAELGDIHMPNFGEYFMKVINKYYGFFENFVESLNVDLTYMFELVGPYNRVVIPYEKSDVYFLGARNKYTGEEYYFCNDLLVGALGLGCFKRPKRYPLYSLNACIKAAEEFSWDQEGFVVVDATGNRVKVKSPAYVLAHFMRNNNVITRKHLINIVLINEVEEFLCYASDYKDELLSCERHIKALLTLGNTFAAICRKARSMPRNAYAEMVRTFPKMFQALLYLNYDRDYTMEDFTSKWHLNKWEEYLEELERLENEWFYSGT